MNRVKVSILVPAFNVSLYLDECLHSLMEQTLKEIEIIFVDDGSSDNTLEIAENYARKDKRLHVFHQTFNILIIQRDANFGYYISLGD